MDMKQLHSQLRQATKEIYEGIHRSQLSDTDLDGLVKESGYDGITAPHQSTIDLIDLFARNLRNSGANGMEANSFGGLIRISLSDFISNNKLESIPLSQVVGSFCQAARENNLVTDHDAKQLDSYYSWIDDSNTRLPKWWNNLQGKPRIIRDLESTFLFCEFLIRHFEGCAENYTDKIATSFGSGSRVEPLKYAINDLIQIPGIGIALASNFLKDSQVSLLKDIERNAWKDHYAAFFVKPDKHVLRLMHLITRRSRFQDLEDLLKTKDGQLAKKYFLETNIQTDSEWPTISVGDYFFSGIQNRGSWKCILDVLFWSDCAGVSPLEIDRLLFFCGSARFGSKDVPAGYDRRKNRGVRYEILKKHLGLESSSLSQARPLI